MTADLWKVFRAGRVMRWHTNADLAGTNDRLDGHEGRVARIILAIHPNPSAALLAAALTHDDGEHFTGDIPYPYKQVMSQDGMRELTAAEDYAAYTIWGKTLDLSETDAKWIKLADRIDAYMWAKFHRPDIMGSDGWPEAFQDIVYLATILRADLKF